jgi:hypothetical protein
MDFFGEITSPATVIMGGYGETENNMGLKRALINALTEKQVRLFEQKTRGDRKTDRHYVQVVSTIDDLTRKKTNDTKRSQQSRQQHKTKTDSTDL